jgi:hypothetical protein
MAENPGVAGHLETTGMPTEDLIHSLQELSASALEQLLNKRQAEDKALRVLLRAAIAREREERRQAREVHHAD